MHISKYVQVARISWENGFVYRLNFVMWRVRMVIQFLTLYFLWAVVTGNQEQIYSYSQSEILTYILLSSLVVAIVFSSRSIDAQGEIASGDLNNHLVKPVNYFSYWLSRDFSDKILNVVFSFLEISVLLLILKPPFILQSNPLTYFHFFLSITLATALYFIFSFIVSMSTFWYYQHNGWAQRFLVFVLLRTLGGGLFPIDMLPPIITKILLTLPTAYFIYFPMQVYLERLEPIYIYSGYLIQVFWIIILYFVSHLMWKKGLKIYGAFGR
ncbi:ABC transporter permease [Pseudomonadota bacterium]